MIESQTKSNMSKQYQCSDVCTSPRQAADYKGVQKCSIPNGWSNEDGKVKSGTQRWMWTGVESKASSVFDQFWSVARVAQSATFGHIVGSFVKPFCDKSTKGRSQKSVSLENGKMLVQGR